MNPSRTASDSGSIARAYGTLPTRTHWDTIKLQSGRVGSRLLQYGSVALGRLRGNGTAHRSDPIAREEFQLSGCRTLDQHPIYQQRQAAVGFQEGYERFIAEICQAVNEGHPESIIHFGDGDYYVLTDQPIGSARPGYRAISRRLSLQERTRLAEGLAACTRHAVDLAPRLQAQFREVMGSDLSTFPTEYIYAALASRRLTREFPDCIGLIGAESKLRVIRTLESFSSYREYLGIERFADYIPIPQKFAADNPSAVIDGIRERLEASQSRLFLVGAGSAKMGMLHELPKIHSAVYLDVGSGIDALAGVVDPRRPYFADWVNFRLEDKDLYQEMDLLQVEFYRNVIYANTDVQVH